MSVIRRKSHTFAPPAQDIAATSQQLNFVFRAEPAIAGPSRLGPALNESSRATSQKKIVSRLIQGHGVSEFEWIGLVEKCGSCNRYFLAAVLNEHVLICAP